MVRHRVYQPLFSVESSRAAALHGKVFSLKKRIISIITVLILILSFSGGTSSFAAVSRVPELEADSAVLMNADTGEILYEKNMDAEQYPASTTKLMTGLLALENSTMEDVVTFSGGSLEWKWLDFNYVKFVFFYDPEEDEMAVLRKEIEDLKAAEALFAD